MRWQIGLGQWQIQHICQIYGRYKYIFEKYILSGTHIIKKYFSNISHRTQLTHDKGRRT